jgi:hypothetical protein
MWINIKYPHAPLGQQSPTDCQLPSVSRSFSSLTDALCIWPRNNTGCVSFIQNSWDQKCFLIFGDNPISEYLYRLYQLSIPNLKYAKIKSFWAAVSDLYLHISSNIHPGAPLYQEFPINHLVAANSFRLVPLEGIILPGQLHNDQPTFAFGPCNFSSSHRNDLVWIT